MQVTKESVNSKTSIETIQSEQIKKGWEWQTKPQKSVQKDLTVMHCTSRKTEDLVQCRGKNWEYNNWKLPPKFCETYKPTDSISWANPKWNKPKEIHTPIHQNQTVEN